jgi:hypothetical protein
LAQEVKDKPIGFFLGLELANKPSDALRTAGANRKFSFGARVTSFRYGITAKIGVGFKAIKHNAFKTSYQTKFLTQVQDNYIPVMEDGLEKTIAESMYELATGNPEYNTNTSYNQFIHFSLIFDKVFLKPSISFNIGKDHPNLMGTVLQDDLEYLDYSFARGSGVFKEFAISSYIPLLKNERPNFFVIPSVGYQWSNHKEISFEGIPLTTYTTGNIADDYQYSQNIYFSISIVFWTK